MATIIPYLVAGGSLWSGNSVIVSSGAVLVDRDGINWQSWDSNSLTTFAGHRVGVCVNGGIVTPGATGLSIQLLGPLASENFSLGPGNASVVVIGTNNQLTRGIVGQVIGICDSSGAVIVFPTIIGSTPTGQRIIGEIAGYPLNTTPLQVNQTWVWDGSQLSPSTVGGGATVTWANDLVNSTNSNQYVSSLSYSSNAAGGIIAVNGTNTALNWVSNAITLQQNAVTLASLKQNASDFITLGASPQGAGGFIRVPNNLSAINARNAGNTGDITVVGSDASNNAVLGGGSQGTGGALLKANAVTVGQLQVAVTDYIALGTSPAASGLVRVSNNVIAVKARNVSGNNDVSLLGIDGSDNVLIGGGVPLTGAGVIVRSAANNVVEMLVTNSNPSLLFFDNGVTGAANGAGIAWSAANTVGQGMSVAISAQQAKAASATNGGQVTIASGAGDGVGSDGGINFGFNLTQGGGITDKVQFVGANTSAGRGTFQWSSAITPALVQSAAATTSGGPVAGINFSITAQAGQATTGVATNALAGGNLNLTAGAGGASSSAQGGNGGNVQLMSGAGGTGGTFAGNSGGVVIGWGGNVNNNITFSGGAFTGNMVWTQTLLPRLFQTGQAVHNGNATDFQINPQVNTDGTSTSGRSGNLLLYLGAPPNTSTVESQFNIQRLSIDTLSMGPYPTAPTAAALWLCTANAGANATSANFTLYGDNVQTIINSPNAGKILMCVGNNSTAQLVASGFLPFNDNTAALGAQAGPRWGSFACQMITINSNGFGGNGAGFPFNWIPATGISITATTNLTAVQVGAPYLAFTGAAPVGASSLFLHTGGGSGTLGSVYILDMSAVTGLGTNTVIVKVGTATKTFTISSAAVFKIVVTGANSLWGSIMS